MDVITHLRAQATPKGFTNKSKLEYHFLDAYNQLVEEDRPTVTEYGAGVPILSIYLLLKNKISKLTAIENDPTTITELEHITETLGLPIDIVQSDINNMNKFPETDLGISVNTLFGYAPTWEQGARGAISLPVIVNDVVGKSNHDKLGIFRFIYNSPIWPEFDEAQKTLEEHFENVSDLSLGMISGETVGYQKQMGTAMPYGYSTMSGFGGILLAENRKKE